MVYYADVFVGSLFTQAVVSSSFRLEMPEVAPSTTAIAQSEDSGICLEDSLEENKENLDPNAFVLLEDEAEASFLSDKFLSLKKVSKKFLNI